MTNGNENGYAVVIVAIQQKLELTTYVKVKQKVVDVYEREIII
jgi:hypothetical protein